MREPLRTRSIVLSAPGRGTVVVSDDDARVRFRRFLAFAAPVLLLVMTPNEPIISPALGITFLIVTAMSSPKTTRLGIEWVYAGAVLALLSVDALVRPPRDFATLVYISSTMLPFGLALAMLLDAPSQVRRFAQSTMFLGVALALLVIATLSRDALGAGRYQLIGNYCAVASLLLLHGWTVRSSILSGALVTLTLVGVGISAARQSFAILLAGVLFVILLRMADHRGARRPLLLLSVLGLIVFLAWEPLVEGPILGSSAKRFNVLLEQGVQQTERPLLWSTAWDGFRSAPLFGHGLDSFTQLDEYPSGLTAEQYPHSVPLGLLADLGFFGFTVILVPPVLAAIRLLIQRRWDTAVGAVLLLFAAASVLSMFSGDLTNRLLWVGMLLTIRVASSRDWGNRAGATATIRNGHYHSSTTQPRRQRFD